LRADSVELDFTGGVSFVPGALPVSRPYVRFTGLFPDTVSRIFGKNNPTFASTADSGHSAGLAADGDASSYWRPSSGDSAAWWRLDMEKRVKIDSIVIDFGTPGLFRYVLEIGENGHWQKVEEGTSPSGSIMVRGVAGREVRIRFPKPSEARLAEVKVVGRVLP
jgi:hypothetical protein